MGKSFEFIRMPYQAKGPVEEATIAQWERARGKRLPEDYRRFLLMTNGGALRPYAFDLVVPDPRIPDRVHALECLFDWDEVLEESQEDIPLELRNTPPNRIAIGNTVSELVIMLSLADADFGAIDAWVRDIQNVWGEGANNVVVPLTQSFRKFLNLLRDDPAGETYQSYWATHDERGRVAKQLEWP